MYLYYIIITGIKQPNNARRQYWYIPLSLRVLVPRDDIRRYINIYNISKKDDHCRYFIKLRMTGLEPP